MKSPAKTKMQSVIQNKTTIMLIPHSEKAVFSWHIPHWLLYTLLSVLLLSSVSSIILSPILSKKIDEYKYFSKKNSRFEKQIDSATKFLPNISKSEKSLRKNLNQIFSSMGLEQNKAYKMNGNSDVKMLEENSAYFLDYLSQDIRNIGLYIENFRTFFRSAPSVTPLRKHYYISSPFGWRTHPVFHKRYFHYGIDLAIMAGTPIYATASGTIKTAGWHGGYGNAVFITHKEGFQTRYGHMLKFASGIRQGVHVQQGQVIGYVGATGVATGYHLHYEVRMNDDAIDPKPYIWLNRFY